MHGAPQAQAVRGARVISSILTDSARPLERDGRTHVVAGLAARRIFPLLRIVAASAIVAFCVCKLLAGNAGPLLSSFSVGSPGREGVLPAGDNLGNRREGFVYS